MAFIVVDFPAPLPPMTVTKSPASKESDSPFRAGFSLIVPRLNTLMSYFNSNIKIPPLGV